MLNKLHPEKHPIIDSMLAHEAPKNRIAKIYDDTDANDHPIEIAKLEREWADPRLKDAPDAFKLVGLRRRDAHRGRCADRPTGAPSRRSGSTSLASICRFCIAGTV